MLAKPAPKPAPKMTPTQDDAHKIIMKYRIMLKKTEDEHKKTIEDAHNQLNQLIAETDSAVDEQIEEAAAKAQPTIPQTVWIKGTDDEDFLLCNKSAVNQINRLFTGFQEVIDQLRKELGQKSV